MVKFFCYFLSFQIKFYYYLVSSISFLTLSIPSFVSQVGTQRCTQLGCKVVVELSFITSYTVFLVPSMVGHGIVYSAKKGPCSTSETGTIVIHRAGQGSRGLGYTTLRYVLVHSVVPPHKASLQQLTCIAKRYIA